jgi:hypothetical protein
VVIIGRDVTHSAYLNRSPYLSEDSQAGGYLICDFLSQLRAWQNRNNDTTLRTRVIRFTDDRIRFVALAENQGINFVPDDIRSIL